MNDEVPSFIGDANGALYDFEVCYLDHRGCPQLDLVRQSKALKNALASFHRARPRHGQIRSVRKVVSQ